MEVIETLHIVRRRGDDYALAQALLVDDDPGDPAPPATR
jgi:hypothetical protein